MNAGSTPCYNRWYPADEIGKKRESGKFTDRYELTASNMFNLCRAVDRWCFIYTTDPLRQTMTPPRNTFISGRVTSLASLRHKCGRIGCFHPTVWLNLPDTHLDGNWLTWIYLWMMPPASALQQQFRSRILMPWSRTMNTYDKNGNMTKVKPQQEYYWYSL